MKIIHYLSDGKNNEAIQVPTTVKSTVATNVFGLTPQGIFSVGATSERFIT